MLAKKIHELFTKHAFAFRDEADKEVVISELQEKYDVFGNTIVNKKNGVVVSDEEIIPVMWATCKGYLQALTRGSYVPKYADNRDIDTKVAHSKEVFKTTELFFERYGFKFKGENLGDNSLKQIVKSRIAEHFMFEGYGENNEVVFRKHYQGMFSDPIAPEVLIPHMAGPYLDAERTRERQDEIRMEIEAGVLKKFGVQFKNQLDRNNQKLFEDEFNKKFKAHSTITTNKELPIQEPKEYEQEFARRSMFRLGLRDESEATSEQRNIIDFSIREGMEELNGLPNNNSQVLADLRNWRPPQESWGFSTVNESGYKMSAEQL